ncbi:hypothetical protein LTR37_002758 [Vermiconidia calcicola]|uniref:Uncharacterized protein n=1 Tax=Vermiconidia calcicola TaxID=1690605 RepID=A0ACC3NRP3_9PEZI|nr:hypothetical protein LTR37_002758 [Vermiconidia calcicola]
MDGTSSTQQQYPNLNPYENTNGNSNANGSVENAKNNVMNSEYSSTPPTTTFPQSNLPTAAQNTMNSVKNSQTVQSLNAGPMADKARYEADNTKTSFSNLAASKQTPSTQTATGQDLTHYHSFFYNLLSWENPRATAISYLGIVIFIFATRYVPLVRYMLKAAYMILGITASAEIGGRLVLGQGFATKMRPQRYYKIPRETLESVMEDLTELANFFVIELQRVVFAENIGVTVGAFTTALLTYFLVKITPAWGLALLFTTVGFFVPLAYIQNQEFIDAHVTNAQTMISNQATQVRDLASEHTNKAMNASSSALKDYGAKAQEMMGSAKKTAVEKGVVSEETAAKAPGGTDGSSDVKTEDFPSAPASEPARYDGAEDQGVSSQEQYGEKEPQYA